MDFCSLNISIRYWSACYQLRALCVLGETGLGLNSHQSFFLCLNTSLVFTNYQPRQCNASYNKAFIVGWSLSGKLTSKLAFCESEYIDQFGVSFYQLH